MYDELVPCDNPTYDIAGQLGKAVQFHRTGQLQKAREIYEKILEIDPDNPDALHLLGLVSHHFGQDKAAVGLITKATRLHPEYPFYHNSLGLVLKDQGKSEEALACYQKALALKPDYPEAQNNMGVAFQDQGKLHEALACYRKALASNPNAAEALNNIGNVLKDQDKLDKAISSYQKALAIRPDYLEAYNNMGVVFQYQNKFELALSSYQKTLQLSPDYVEAHINMGIVFQYQGKLDEAVACYKKALEIEPDNADAHFHCSCVLLLSGNLEEGWKEYEWRLRRDEWKRVHVYKHNTPQWDGSSFEGKTLFIHAEQGLGDTLQFSRYLRLVKKLGGKVIFETGKPLLNLFKTLDGVDELIQPASSEPWGLEYDLYAPLMSVPGLLTTTLDTIPDEVPYLKADPVKTDYWGKRLPKGGFRIGLVWAGKPAPNDNRPCALNNFFPLSEIPGTYLCGLQKGEAACQVQGLPEGMDVINLGEELADFADTAGVIENLDLVISIDTSVAHLAGAMGKPVWTLLPFAPDWRWLLDREDCPWYPTMRLFRQSAPGKWDVVLQRVADELRALIKDL